MAGAVGTAVMSGGTYLDLTRTGCVRQALGESSSICEPPKRVEGLLLVINGKNRHGENEGIRIVFQ